MFLNLETQKESSQKTLLHIYKKLKNNKLFKKILEWFTE